MTKTKEDIQKIILKRMAQEKVEIQTVGDLVAALNKYDQNTPVVATQFFECITDAGSDLGSDEECVITNIVDLDTRVVIEVDRWKKIREYSDRW